MDTPITITTHSHLIGMRMYEEEKKENLQK